MQVKNLLKKMVSANFTGQATLEKICPLQIKQFTPLWKTYTSTKGNTMQLKRSLNRFQS